MSILIQLDSQSPTYTNLDFITGRVILYLQSSATFSSITVKLEGESRTRLAGLKKGSGNDGQQAKQTTEMEFHRLLYKTYTVFPTPELQQQTKSASSYTLPPGSFEYPFKFKLPFNNICSDSNNLSLTNMSFAGMKVEVLKDTNRHVKRTLPPSLSGFPGMAEIKYFIKVTATRPKFYQENIRAFHDFRFMPIEPPRPDSSRNEEAFARRSHKFAKTAPPAPRKFTVKRSPSSNIPPIDLDPPAFTVDARLPSPSILTCNGALPLRILVRRTNQSSETLFLSTLSIELFAFTNVRAHDLTRTETGSWILTSQSSINATLGTPGDPVDKEHKVPKRFLEHIRVPNTVCPSFEACNLSRSYELEVRVGLNHGLVGNIKPELIVLPLRFPVKIYSGIAPPTALLQAMNSPRPSVHRPTVISQPTDWPSSPSQFGVTSPVDSSFPPPTSGYPPVQAATSSVNPQEQPFDEAPPTYEEALAEDMAPVDGPRENYNPLASPSPGLPYTGGDGTPSSSHSSPIGEKEGPFPPDSGGSGSGGNIHRMPSERLFPNSMGSTTTHFDDSDSDKGPALPRRKPVPPSPTSPQNGSESARPGTWKGKSWIGSFGGSKR